MGSPRAESSALWLVLTQAHWEAARLGLRPSVRTEVEGEMRCHSLSEEHGFLICPWWGRGRPPS